MGRTEGPRGWFISFEGGDGAGKTTQVRLLAEALRTAGRAVVTTREPGGSPGAEEIRTLVVTGAPDRWDAVTEALLMSAARRAHVEATIRPALAQGAVVISDRFADSTTAYQGHAGGVPLDTLERLRQVAVGDLMPDLTLILDLPVDEGLARSRHRGGADRFEGKGRDFHERLRRGFLTIAAAEPARCRVIDARGDAAVVHQALWPIVRERLGL